MKTMNNWHKFILFITVHLISQIVCMAYSTNVIAEMLRHQPALFGRLSQFGNFYFPWMWIAWYEKYGNAETEWLFSKYGMQPAMLTACLVTMVFILAFVRFNRQEVTTHGSAHFATKEEIVNFGNGTDNDLLSGEGVFLGCLDDGTYLRDKAKTHVLCCAPTRSGKGVGHIVPTLLTWNGSVVVTDIKGENWDLTAGYRKNLLDNKVFMFKPTARGSCHYNPFDEIRIGTTNEMGDLQNITKILVDPTGKGSEGANSHWVNNAWDLLQGVALHLLYEMRFHESKNKPRTANLADVLDFLYDGQEGSSVDYERKFQHNVEVFFSVEEKTVEVTGKSVPLVVKQYDDVHEHLESTIKDMSNMMQGTDEYLDTGSGDDFYDGDEIDISETGAMEKLRESFEEKAKANDTKQARTHLAGELGMSKAEAKKAKENEDENQSDTLSGLQKKLSRYITNYKGTGKGFCHAPDDDKEMFKRLYPDKMHRDGLHPHVRQIFQSMVDKPDKEFGSILSTLNTALIIYRNPVIVENISYSDFVMKDIMDCNNPVSLYLVFGPGEMDVVRPLLRVVVEMLWRLNTEELTAHQHRLLMLLDEFPALGKMEALAFSEGFIAGYGMKAMIITQDLNQINNLYGKDNCVVSNCQVQIYHTPSDNNSGRYLSDKLGNTTVSTTSSSRGSSIFPFATGYNDSYVGRPLMYPNEITTMDQDRLLLFCKGLSPIFCKKIKYYEDPIFLPRTKIRPPVSSEKIKTADRKWNYSDYHSLCSK